MLTTMIAPSPAHDLSHVSLSKTEPELESLDLVLGKMLDEYRKDNPKSQQLFEKSLKNMPGGNTRSSIAHDPFPLTLERGEAEKLFDVDGHEYIDFLGEFSAGVYGHSCQPIRKAINDAMDKGWSFGGKNLYEDRLAKIVVERFRHSMELVRFTNSGTEANLMAIGAAIAFTGKQKILVFLNAYHGGALMFLDLNVRNSLNARYDFVVAPYNDIAGTNAAIANLPAATLAAIIVEPIQVSGGCIPGRREFLFHLRQLATEQQAVLIFDEVMTSRLCYGGYQVQLDIKPDLTTVGKWVGGGMSFGAFGGRREIMKLFDPREGRLGHSGTFNNNIVTMAAGIAGCQLMTKARIDALNSMGNRLHEQISDLIHKRLPCSTMFVIGRGSLFAIRFTGPEQKSLSKLLYHHLLQNGVHIANRGFLALHIEITDAHFQPLLAALESFIDSYRPYLIG